MQKLETHGTPEKNNFYINEKINPYLLWSQTTLRHIKEFYRQFFKNEEITKASREGLELLTSSVYGVQNYYYYNIDRICEEAQ